MAMTFAFRVLLLAAAVLMLWLVLSNIRRAKLAISDSLFWFFFAAVFVLLALFPEIAFWASRLLGIQSPVNLVFLLIIAVLIWRLFHLTLRLSAQNAKIEDIAQRMALDANERESKQ
jgi:hypothetical protein